jgi:hypothetical protein
MPRLLPPATPRPCQQVILEYVDKKTRTLQQQNKVAEWLMCLVRGLMWLLEKIVAFINRNAFVLVAGARLGVCVCVCVCVVTARVRVAVHAAAHRHLHTRLPLATHAPRSHLRVLCALLALPTRSQGHELLLQRGARRDARREQRAAPRRRQHRGRRAAVPGQAGHRRRLRRGRVWHQQPGVVPRRGALPGNLPV